MLALTKPLTMIVLATSLGMTSSVAYSEQEGQGTINHKAMNHKTMNHKTMDHATGDKSGQIDHSQHQAMMSKAKRFQRTIATYDLPNVALTNQLGQNLKVAELGKSQKPQALNFIFATCTTICPVMTATFAQMRRELGDDADRIEMLSITIDPEHDTPAVLEEYAGRFGAPPPPNWSFLTGHPDDVAQVLQAFDAWSGSKAAHRPITLLRGAGEQAWVRLEGLGSGADLAAEARALLN